MAAFPERNAFLRAVLTDPADDVPRLVLADWLDEHADDPCPRCNGSGYAYCPRCSGEGCSAHGIAANGPCLAGDCPVCDRSGKADELARERAEFIRVQCERARPVACLTPSVGMSGLPCRECRPRNKRDCLPWCRECERFDDLREREKLLLSLSGDMWLGRADGFETAWERGFVSELRGDVGEFLYLAAALFAEHPVTSVRPTGVRPLTLPQFGVLCAGWSENERDDDGSGWVLPAELFTYLPPCELSDVRIPGQRWYRSEARAWEAVSVAGVGYGRALSDLPPLDLWQPT
jgi:uncharacterized protein (TIGR02996 family)